jgi:hypothetical protein
VATTETERDLNRLETELKKLEAEYNMFFSGRSAKPPWETRSRVEALIRQYDRAHIRNYGERFRFQTLQARFTSFINLWDRGQRSREEGRSGPFAAPKKPALQAPARRGEDVLHVASFQDPLNEMEKVQALYDSVSEARRQLGERAVPFEKFAELVKTQVNKLKTTEGTEVAFRVAVKDGKVSFTAKPVKRDE